MDEQLHQVDQASSCKETEKTFFVGGQPPIHPEFIRQDIGWAVKQMWSGLRVFRQGWNGRGQTLGIQFPDRSSKNTLPYVYIITVQNQRIPWLCSQTDLLATDWEVAK